MSKIGNITGVINKTVVIVVACVLSFAALAFRQHAQVYSAPNGKVAYAAYDGVIGAQIYTINADGSGQQQLTNDDHNNFQPNWSPDGSKIIYASDVHGDGTWQIFVMNADGSNQVNLTNDTAINGEPKWSPDGSKIAYTYTLDGSDPTAIYIMNANGSGKTQISSGAEGDFSPSWNPNGNSLIYTCPDGTHDQFCTINSNGSGQSQLTHDALEHGTAAYSPDGTRIAFSANTNPYDYRLMVMNADGSNLQSMVTSNYENRNVSWSPDGTKLLYDGAGGSTSQLIYYINPDGSGETAITADGTDAFMPSWQPVVDTDGDGVLNSSEAAGPNNGDSNGDGIADKDQPQVTNFVNPLTGKYNVLQSTCSANGSTTVSAVPAAYKDTGFTYSGGLLNFTLTCATQGATATVTLYYYGLTTTASQLLRKYNTTTHSYQTIPGMAVSAVTIGGQTLTKATYQITDGGPLDQDNAANGIIVDPVGIATPTVGAPNTGLGGTAR